MFVNSASSIFLIEESQYVAMQAYSADFDKLINFFFSKNELFVHCFQFTLILNNILSQ